MPDVILHPSFPFLRRLARWLVGGSCLFSLCACAAPPPPVTNAPTLLLSADEQRLVDARDAWRKRDRAKLASLRDALVAARHPLAMWADYWELNGRLDGARTEDLEAFYSRWPGTYVEDRLRNDWLLVLGRRRDWAAFALDYPRFRMNDDREVTCYALATRQLRGEDVREAGRAAWLAQRDSDDGCALLGKTLFDAGLLGFDDLWVRARMAAEANRPRTAQQSVQMLGDVDAASVGELFDNPQRYLARKADASTRSNVELAALALVRWSASDPAATATELATRWQPAMLKLDGNATTWAWAAVAKNAALKLMPEAEGYFAQAIEADRARPLVWSDEALAWRARAALRATDGQRWQRMLDAIGAMSPTEQREPAWHYWKARALLAQAPVVARTAASNGTAADAPRPEGEVQLERLSSQFNFYGKLASEDLGRTQALPPRPVPLTAEESSRAERHAGLNRALALISLGLRNEGVREWNYALRDFSGDRELLAAAQLACDRQVWDRCINTSERTRVEIDMAQRFPTPFRGEVMDAAQKAGLDPALVYGLIRQESRFVTDARSSVGASGLMQLIPATAQWTARKIGTPYSGAQITDRATNLALGTAYFKLLLDDFEGSAALATAGYNAGPNRPRRWREGPVLEVAAWAENIPFNETRDYVKKVLSNASDYAALLAGRTTAPLKARLGQVVGPRPPSDPPENKELP